MAQSDSDVGSEAGHCERDAPYSYQPFTGSFFGAFVAKIQDLDPLTDGRLQRYYRQLSDEERNMVTANMLIHSGRPCTAGLVKESISMWKCVLDMYKVDTGGLKLQVAMAVPMYLSTVAHAGKVYKYHGHIERYAFILRSRDGQCEENARAVPRDPLPYQHGPHILGIPFFDNRCISCWR